MPSLTSLLKTVSSHTIEHERFYAGTFPHPMFLLAFTGCADKNLYKLAWDKCEHAARHGAVVGVVWVRIFVVLVFVLYRD